MRRNLVLLCILLATPFAYPSTAPTGSVELDEISFDKILDKFESTLVKFDVAYPYGDKHDAFVALAKDARYIGELLVAEVGVKDYGDKDNEALAKKYGATKDNFPVVKLFLKGKSEPLTFDDSKGFTSDELRRFVREHTGIYLSLPGCVKELDELAVKFMKSSAEDRKKVIKKVEKVQEKLPAKDELSGKIYKLMMEKIMDKGDDFITGEYERIQKVLNKKLSTDKKAQLQSKMNILQTFIFQDKQNKEKEEL